LYSNDFYGRVNPASTILCDKYLYTSRYVSTSFNDVNYLVIKYYPNKYIIKY